MLRNFILARALRAGLATGLLTGLAPLALAQQIGPDATFATAGTVTTGLTGPRFSFSSNSPGAPVWSMMGQALVQPDGKVLVCAADANRWTLRRYNANGTLDTGFGTGGSVTSTFPASQSVANGLALQPNGQIVVVGGISGLNANVWAAARYSAQGVPDASFGTAGLAYGNPSFLPTELTRVVVLPDGKLLAAASYAREAPTHLLRLLANGQPDNSYVPQGNPNYVGYRYYGMFRDMLALPNGKVLVTTSSVGGTIPVSSARLARYNADGTPDTSFGTNGEVPITGYSTIPGQQNSPRYTSIYSLALQPDGKILAAGCIDNGLVGGGNAGENPALFRLNADGSPDTAFNTAVAASSRYAGGAGFAAVTLQSDGSIVVGGNFGQLLLLARYSSAGVLDASFATITGYPAGVYTAAAGTRSIVRTLSTLPNNQLLAWEGVLNTSNTMDMRLTRYTAAQPTAVRRPELALQLQAAPVPTNRQLHLRYTLPAAATPQALLRDQLGRVVTTVGGVRQAAGPQALQLDLQHLAAGSYLLTLEAGQWQQTVRVVKQ